MVALVGTLVHHRSTSVRAEATKMFWEITRAHGIRPEVHYPIPEFPTLAARDWVHRIPRALAALGVGLYNHVQLRSPQGRVVTLRTTKLRHRDTGRLTVPHRTPGQGNHGPHHSSPGNNNPRPAAVRECLNQCADEHLHYCCCKQEPPDQPGWRNAPLHLYTTTGSRDPRLRLINPTRVKQDAHTVPQVTSDGLHLHIRGYRRQGSLSPLHAEGGIPPTGGPPVYPPRRTRGRGAPGTQRGCGVA